MRACWGCRCSSRWGFPWVAPSSLPARSFPGPSPVLQPRGRQASLDWEGPRRARMDPREPWGPAPSDEEGGGKGKGWYKIEVQRTGRKSSEGWSRALHRNGRRNVKRGRTSLRIVWGWNDRSMTRAQMRCRKMGRGEGSHVQEGWEQVLWTFPSKCCIPAVEGGETILDTWHLFKSTKYLILAHDVTVLLNRGMLRTELVGAPLPHQQTGTNTQKVRKDRRR